MLERNSVPHQPWDNCSQTQQLHGSLWKIPRSKTQEGHTWTLDPQDRDTEEVYCLRMLNLGWRGIVMQPRELKQVLVYRSRVLPWKWKSLSCVWLIVNPQEMWVRSLGQKDPLEEEMAIHSSILAWKIPWTEEPGRLQSNGSLRVVSA